jgi:alcohol dehydrogenase
VIDTAKGANILASEGSDDLREFAGADVLKNRLKPLIVVPTTSGTGSEVTIFAVISDPERKRKMLFTSVHLMPDVGVLDPRMTMTLPPHITSATGMDALTHAVESYLSLGRNPLSDAYAAAAIRLLAENLVPALKKPKDAGLRLALANASTLAGIAFSNAGVGMVHALGHSLGSICHIPHGVAMNVFLPHGMEYNRSKAEDRVGELLLPLGGPELYARTDPAGRADEAVACVRRLQDQLFDLSKLPRSLSETGKVERSQFEEIAKSALGDGAVLYNPEALDFEDMMSVLDKAWE